MFSSCATTKDSLLDISLDMKKSQVREEMGNPKVVRGSIKNKYGQIVEVWEYRLCDNKVSIGQGCEDYWLYFVDGTLAQWGKAGDWQREADKIYEFRIK